MQNYEKIWLKHYPKDMPHEININDYQSLAELFEAITSKFKHQPAFTNLGKTISYEELDKQSKQFAAYLQSIPGLKKGDRIAVMLPNVLQYPIAVFGILQAGMVVANVNPLYTKRELKHQLVDSEAKIIIILENFAHVLASVIEQTNIQQVITTQIGDLLAFPKSMIVNFVIKYIKRLIPKYQLNNTITFKTILNNQAKNNYQPIELCHDDIAFLQYTGGTTGVAKGAILTHGNMVANVLQATEWLGPKCNEGKEIIITALPLYHIFALTANCLAFMKLGGLNYLITNPRDFDAFVKEISTIKFSAITGVNTLFNALLNTPAFENLDFSNLKISLAGGMALQSTVAKRWKQVTNCTLLEAYGLTETAPAACINPLDLEDYNGYIGLPIPSTECSIQDDQGNLLPSGEIGELCIRGPQVMKGYWKRPKETTNVLDQDGWFHSGDMAYMSEQGYFKIVDRKKDMILVSGFNVYPNELEDVIAMHPGVNEVGVIGVPDERSGEAIKAIVVKNDSSLTEQSLLGFCRENLTGYKIPKYIVFTDQLPKSNVGKILRRELREQFLGKH